MSEESKFKRENTLLKAKLRNERIKTMAVAAVPATPSNPDSGSHYFEYSGQPTQSDADKSLERMVRPRTKIQEEQHG